MALRFKARPKRAVYGVVPTTKGRCRCLASCRAPLRPRCLPVWEGTTAADALDAFLRLAAAVDRLAYERFWGAEHHAVPNLATSAPAVLAGAVAGATRRIRVESGGVLLPLHSAFAVGEQFGTVAALHPGRIDLGI